MEYKKNSIKGICLPQEECAGCSACYSICPQKAISMINNNEGFKHPYINKDLCINCGLCEQVCPVLNASSQESFETKTYACWNKDESIRLQSSSGGVFSIIAEHVLNKGGFVCGAAFDKKLLLEHIIISDKKDLYKLRGSKYLQSDLKDTFRSVKDLLQDGKFVLFSGTPCQISGLNKFLKKEYNNLITIDLICHGVPSPLVFKEYIKSLGESKNIDIKRINFRDKSEGWKRFSLTLNSDENKDKHSFIENLKSNIYMQGFLKNLYLRESCFSCDFMNPRPADITLGDFWGVQNHYPELDDNKGTSVILANSNKGHNIIQNIKHQFSKIQEIDINHCIEKNPCLIKPVSPHENRSAFFNEFINTDQNIEKLIKKNLKTPFFKKLKKKYLKIKSKHF